MVDQNIIEFLSKLQVSPEGATIYLVLMNQPAQTAQAIARKTGIPKTTVYRRVEELESIGLVEEQVGEGRKTYSNASANLLSLLVTKKEQEAAELRAQLPIITQLLHSQADNSDPETKVLFYRRRDGIQQMLWNVLHAQAEAIGYTYRDIAPFVGRKFYDTWHDEFQHRQLKGRDIFSDEYIKSKFESANPSAIGWQDWESRYLPPGTLDIQHQMDVYNNVVGIYNWVGPDVFGVEIYNDKVASLQRQLFELAWKKGVILDQTGQRKRYESLTA